MFEIPRDENGRIDRKEWAYRCQTVCKHENKIEFVVEGRPGLMCDDCKWIFYW